MWHSVDLSLAHFSTLKMQVARSSETADYNKPTRRHIPENDILQNHRRPQILHGI
jgi:hypothetical protein